mgnify:CR=1 FL=1
MEMTTRWFTLLLSLVMAVPLCCCGWHAAKEDKAAPACPMCAAAADDLAAEDEGCPCQSEWVQRDLAPKSIVLSTPSPSFAALPEVITGSFSVSPGKSAALVSRHLEIRLLGPPRLYLRYRALLC